jgi:hypothetical protein
MPTKNSNMKSQANLKSIKEKEKEITNENPIVHKEIVYDDIDGVKRDRNNMVWGLSFESRFECGNLFKAELIRRKKVSLTDPIEYYLYLRKDMKLYETVDVKANNGSGASQWYFFQIRNTKTNRKYRFSLFNFTKSSSSYAYGMKPAMFSTKSYEQNGSGWFRVGSDIKYEKDSGKLAVVHKYYE